MPERFKNTAMDGITLYETQCIMNGHPDLFEKLGTYETAYEDRKISCWNYAVRCGGWLMMESAKQFDEAPEGYYELLAWKEGKGGADPELYRYRKKECLDPGGIYWKFLAKKLHNRENGLSADTMDAQVLVTDEGFRTIKSMRPSRICTAAGTEAGAADSAAKLGHGVYCKTLGNGLFEFYTDPFAAMPLNYSAKKVAFTKNSHEPGADFCKKCEDRHAGASDGRTMKISELDRFIKDELYGHTGHFHPDGDAWRINRCAEPYGPFFNMSERLYGKNNAAPFRLYIPKNKASVLFDWHGEFIFIYDEKQNRVNAEYIDKDGNESGPAGDFSIAMMLKAAFPELGDEDAVMFEEFWAKSIDSKSDSGTCREYARFPKGKFMFRIDPADEKESKNQNGPWKITLTLSDGIPGNSLVIKDSFDRTMDEALKFLDAFMKA